MKILVFTITVLLIISLCPTIAYTQEETTQTPIPSPTPVVNTNDLTDIITPSGLIQEDILLSSDDKRAEMRIPAGSILLSINREPIQYIEFQTLNKPPIKLPGEDIGSIPYYFGPEGTTVDPPSTLLIRYNSINFPEGIVEEDLLIVYLDSKKKKWIEMPYSIVNAGSDTITVEVSHLTTFAIYSPSSRTIPFNLWLIPIIVIWLAIIFRVIVYINSRSEKK